MELQNMLKTVTNVTLFLRPPESTIGEELIPVLTKGRNPNNVERELLETNVIAPRLGELGISTAQNLASLENQNFLNLTCSLTNYIVLQDQSSKAKTKKIKVIRSNLTKSREKSEE